MPKRTYTVGVLENHILIRRKWMVWFELKAVNGEFDSTWVIKEGGMNGLKVPEWRKSKISAEVIA